MTAATLDGDGPAMPVSGSNPDKADLAAWLAVVAGILGALMATLDITIVNSALPTIQGEIGASGTEGTWIATSYLVAEIIIIPLTGWLERVLGLRTLLLTAAILFTTFSILCGLSTTLTMMIIGRAGQGLTGGAMIPTAMTIIATRLPRPQQAIGTALYAVSGVLGPVLGPLAGGWLTENLSWHYAFFINIPVCIALVVLLFIGLPHRKLQLHLIRQADWLGIVGMALALGALTVVLEEGHREQWFDSALMVKLTLLSIVGLAMLTAGQFFSRRPVIRLALLRDRQFASIVMMALVLGVVMYGTNYLIPQFVATIAGYNALQAGQVLMFSALPLVIALPLIPLMTRRLDIRVAVTSGFVILALSCWLETRLSGQSSGSGFVMSQILRGIGMVLTFVFLNQAAIVSVPREYASDASGLYNAARNFGGSLALSAMATLQDERLAFHSSRLAETLGQSSVNLHLYLADLGDLVGEGAALRALAGTVAREALVMTYNDLFLLVAISTMIVAPLALFLKPLPAGPAVAMH
ncbi:DHA2 family multidrug resistance protein [Sphingobium boeckii]|uniref:DHA2 family multidrug resistance protein n=2 Tax=Sphingobium boeckii TaxID=1082345 RepID=A0A7W9ED64_9SPHN|nr:DHA2 family multidrug resistance protein [Sphingobium boeckii]